MKAAKSLLAYVLKRVEKMTDKQLENSTCVICCPSEVTQIERDVMIELAKNMGISDVFIEEEIKAGALGAGIDIFKSKGVMVVDIGGGTTDVGVLSFGDIVLSRTIRRAGNYIDEEIGKSIKKTRGVEIGELTSETIKINLSNLNEGHNVIEQKFAGRDIVKGIPKWVNIDSEEVRKVIKPVFEEIVKLVAAVLKDTPPELSADIYQNGIVLTGGGSLIKGAEKFISDRIKVPVRIVSNPLTCVAEGTKYLLKNRGDYLLNPLQL
jgi:rod shape-determining protein MreB